MLLTVRNAVNDILYLRWEQTFTGVHNASMKIENSCQILEKSIPNEAVGSFWIEPPEAKVIWIQCCPLVRSLVASSSQNVL